MFALFTALSSGINCTEVSADASENTSVLMTVYKRQIAYHTNKIAQLEKKLSVFPFSMLKLGTVGKPVSDFEEAIEWAEGRMRTEAKEFDEKYGSVEKNNVERIRAYSILKGHEQSWLEFIEEKKEHIKWIEVTDPKKRIQIEEEFTLLKKQSIKHWNKRYHIEQKLKLLREKTIGESIQTRN